MRDGRADSVDGLMQAFDEAEEQGLGKVFRPDDPDRKLHTHGAQPDPEELYYIALEYSATGKTGKAKEVLLRALELDPESVQVYVGLTGVYEQLGQRKKVEQCIALAWKLTQKEFRRWPRQLLWGIFENRPYLRAIANQAMWWHEQGDRQDAASLYTLLLRLNPNDSQGVRYFLAGLYAGKTPNDVDDYMEEGDRRQNWKKIDALLTSQNRRHHFWKDPQAG